MQNSALLGSMNALHTKFPDDPQEEYSRQAKLVLKRLNLEDMVAAIDEAQTTENENNAGDRGSDVENNTQHGNANLRANDANKKPSSSSDEENDNITNDNNVSKDFSEFCGSPDQLTGVFPISSSDVGADAVIDGVLDKSSICKTPIQSEHTNDIKNSNGKACFKNPPALRTGSNSKEIVSSARPANDTGIFSSSTEKSRNIIQMFSKKPVTEVSTTVTKNSNQAPQQKSCSIFTTEELDDGDLDMEWPTDVMSAFGKERTVKPASNSLRGTNENSLSSKLMRFNSKEQR